MHLHTYLAHNPLDKSLNERVDVRFVKRIDIFHAGLLVISMLFLHTKPVSLNRMKVIKTNRFIRIQAQVYTK